MGTMSIVHINRGQLLTTSQNWLVEELSKKREIITAFRKVYHFRTTCLKRLIMSPASFLAHQRAHSLSSKLHLVQDTYDIQSLFLRCVHLGVR